MYIKMIQSGQITELYKYEKTPSERRKSIRKKRNLFGPLRHIIRRKDNTVRQRQNLRRLIWANLSRQQTPIFVTCTIMQVLSHETSSRIFTEFLSYFTKRYQGIRVIAVPEYQKRGALHFHCLVWGLPKGIVEHEKTHRDIQRLWLRGFVDVRSTDGNDKIASYLAKYMSKSVQGVRISSKKAYHTTRNVLRPVSSSSFTSFAGYLEDFIPSTPPLQEKKWDTQWLGSCTYYQYKNNEHENVYSES